MCFRPLVGLGILSYSAYLVHQPINGFMHALFLKHYPVLFDMQTLGITALSLLLTLVVSFVLYKLVEQPMIRWGRRSKY